MRTIAYHDSHKDQGQSTMTNRFRLTIGQLNPTVGDLPGNAAKAREAWAAAGHEREPRVSVSRSIFALVDDRDRAYFGRGNQDADKVGYIDAQTKAIFGRSYAGVRRTRKTPADVSNTRSTTLSSSGPANPDRRRSSLVDADATFP